jgi:hypothetical protein
LHACFEGMGIFFLSWFFKEGEGPRMVFVAIVKIIAPEWLKWSS